jgi:hypothetical protein
VFEIDGHFSIIACSRADHHHHFWLDCRPDSQPVCCGESSVMLPGLTSVLRRDKERQRAAAAGLDTMQSPSQYSPTMQRQISAESPTSSSNPLLYASQVQQPRRAPQPSSYQQASSSQLPMRMLPEEHRAREKEKLAKASLGNAHTQQMMANRQVQQNLTPTRQQQLQPSGQSRYSSQHMESSVTRLLVATKMLLESLTKWSLGQKSETQVSDIYVRLGNDFNVANVAFGSYGIDMR